MFLRCVYLLISINFIVVSFFSFFLLSVILVDVIDFLCRVVCLMVIMIFIGVNRMLCIVFVMSYWLFLC